MEAFIEHIRWQVAAELTRPSVTDRVKVATVAIVTAAAPPPAAPQAGTVTSKFPDDRGYPLMLGDSGRMLWIEDKDSHRTDRCTVSTPCDPAKLWIGGWISQRWDPATNELKDKVELPFAPDLAAETTQGIVFVTNGHVALAAAPDGKIYTADLPVARSKQSVVALADQSVLILDGIVSVAPNGNKTRTSAVERVVLDTGGILSGNKLSVERMPDLPGAVRTAYSTVALADGRAMVLGGTDSPYVGCSPCTAETWLLDPKSKTWSAGPKMSEPRSDMSTTLLPDGSVLVAGGWTPEHTWGGAGSRTVERWDPQKNVFVPMAARMASYMSMHRALWLPGAEGKLLALAGGNSAAIQVYDVEHGIWRVAGETCQGTENNRHRTVIPLLQDQQYALIVQNGEACPGTTEPWDLVQLRLPLGAGDMKTTARAFSGDRGIALYRTGMSFLPGQNDGPSLALGGTIHAGMNNYVTTSAADALWPDGHIQSLPGFLYARYGARLFRLQDGALLLAGGETSLGGYDHTVDEASAAEWLPGNAALQETHWQPLEAAWAQDDALGQMPDGSLVAVSTSGAVNRIMISADKQGTPQVKTSELPPLHEPRLFQEHPDLVVRGLADGRIIVAGGAMQRERLAVMREDSLEPDAPDEYLRIGEAGPTDDYEIYERATGKWRLSAASRSYGGKVAIYDDGRVVRLTANPKKSDESRPVNDDPLIEISSADGKSWSELKAEELPIIGKTESTRIFVLKDELFVAGEQLHTNLQTLQWFNGATRRWETLWQGNQDPNWRNSVGRIIIRQLANGKRVVLPVAGM